MSSYNTDVSELSIEEQRKLVDAGLYYDSIIELPLHRAVHQFIWRRPDARCFYIEMNAWWYPDHLNRLNAFGNTPLHIACRGNSLEAIKLLLDLGADPKTPDARGLFAISFLSPDSVEAHDLLLPLTIKMDPSIAKRSGFSMMHVYCYDEFIEQVRYLISAGAPLNERDTNGRTPLHRAVISRSFQVVEELISQDRCDVDITDKYKTSAYGLAVWFSYSDAAYKEIAEMIKNVSDHRWLNKTITIEGFENGKRVQIVIPVMGQKPTTEINFGIDL